MSYYFPAHFYSDPNMSSCKVCKCSNKYISIGTVHSRSVRSQTVNSILLNTTFSFTLSYFYWMQQPGKRSPFFSQFPDFCSTPHLPLSLSLCPHLSFFLPLVLFPVFPCYCEWWQWTVTQPEYSQLWKHTNPAESTRRNRATRGSFVTLWLMIQLQTQGFSRTWFLMVVVIQ